MPNIELYGFSDDEAKDIKSEIDKLFKLKPWTNDYVVTFIPSFVEDCDAKKQPFLRLVTSEENHVKNIIKELQKLGFDIEIMMLNRFIPKK